MTAVQWTELRCDREGCDAVWPSQPGGERFVRSLASLEGWVWSYSGDLCPAHPNMDAGAEEVAP